MSAASEGLPHGTGFSGPAKSFWAKSFRHRLHRPKFVVHGGLHIAAQCNRFASEIRPTLRECRLALHGRLATFRSNGREIQDYRPDQPMKARWDLALQHFVSCQLTVIGSPRAYAPELAPKR